MRKLLMIVLILFSIQSFGQLTSGEKYNLGPVGQPNMTTQIKGRLAYTVHPWYTSGDDGLLVDKHYTDSAIGAAVGTPSFSFVKGGNAFSTSTQIGLGDNFSLTFITNNTEGAKLDSLGRFTIGPASQRMNVWQGLGGVLGNTGIGYQAMNVTHATVTNSTALGAQALLSDTSGVDNTAIGNGALKNLISGNDNTAVGYLSGRNTTTGTQNTIGGSQSFTANLTGTGNTAWGYGAISGATAANYNSAFGVSTLGFTTGGSNTAIGGFALQSASTGASNSALGTFSLNKTTTGTLNTGIGVQALYLNTIGNGNTAIGFFAGDSVLGNGGVYLGYEAGQREKGNNKLYISDSVNRTLLYGDFGTNELLVAPQSATPAFLTSDNFQVKGSGYFSDSLNLLNTPTGNSADSVLVKHGNAVHAVAQSSITSTSPVIFSEISAGPTITSSAGTLFGTGASGSSLTIAANTLKAGQTIIIHGYANVSTAASGSLNINPIISSTGWTTGFAPGISLSGVAQEFEVTWTILTTGSSGTMQGTVKWLTNGANPFVGVNVSTNPLNTTISNTVDVQMSWTSYVGGDSFNSVVANVKIQ